MNRLKIFRSLMILIFSLFLLNPLTALADSSKASLTGFEEVPSVSTDATGKFKAKLKKKSDEIEYKLSYADVESFVRFAHIHFAQKGVIGGIAVWLCDNTGNGPAGTQRCPEGAGTVEGVITADDVVGPGNQGLTVGEFDRLVEAIDAGAAYVNVHSDHFPTGEIRGQIK